MSKIGAALLNILDLRKGDLRRTLLMQAYLFIIISVLLFLKPVSNSLFLSEFGVGQLPYVFIAVAFVAFIFTKLYIVLQRKMRFIRLHRTILVGIFLSLLLFFIGIRLPAYAGFMIYAFYVWVALFALVATSQFWILANVIFNPREARRVFGIIGAGGIAGGVFGGYVTSIVVPYIGNDGLILLAAGFIALCYPLASILWKERKDTMDNDSLVNRKRQKVAQNFSFRRLRKSRHLIILASLTGIAVMVSKLVDFQFQGIAAAEFTDAKKLTSFFGFWFSTFNVAGLAIQLLLTSRLLKVFGVSKAQFILPGSFIITAMLLFFFPVLWAAVLLKGADGTFKQSIQRSVNELLMLPIPSEIKEQSKTFIDVFVDSFATGISGLILIFLLSTSVVTSTYVSIMILALSGVWLILAVVMKKEYFLSFKKQFLRGSEIGSEQVSGNRSLFQNLNALLEADDENELLRTLDNLEKLPSGLDYSKTLTLLGHSNPEIRYRALQLRPFPERKIRPKIIELLLNDPQLKIRVESYIFLLERNSSISEAEIKNALTTRQEIDDPALLIAASIFFRDNGTMKTELKLEEGLLKLAQFHLVDYGDQANIDLKYHILKAIAYARFRELYSYLDMYLASTISAHREIALRASSFTLSKKYAHILIHAMQEEEYARTAAQSLKFYGETLLFIGDEVLSGKSLKNDAKAKFIRVFSELGSQNAVNYLSQLLNHKSFKVRQEVLNQLSIMQSNYTELDYNKGGIYQRIRKEISIVRKLLSYYYTLNAEFHKQEAGSKRKKLLKRIRLATRKRYISIFLLLGLEYDKKEIFDVYRGLMSKDPLKRTYSLEFMEMYIDYKYGKLISPYLERTVIKKPTNAALEALGIRRTTVTKALSALIKYPDNKLQGYIMDLLETEEMKTYRRVLSSPLEFRNRRLEKRIRRLKEEKKLRASSSQQA